MLGIAAAYTSAVAAAAVSQPKRRACRAAAAPMRVGQRRGRRRSGAARARSRRGSWPCTRKPVCPSPHGHRQPADRRGEHRGAGRLRLYGDQPEGLAVGGHDQHGRRPEPVRELLLADGRPEPYDVARRRAARPASAAPSGLARPLPLGPPTTGTTMRARSVGSLVEQHGDRAQQDVRGLQRLDAAREERDQRVLRQPEPGAGRGAAVRGAEAVEVDAGVDDGDLAGVGVVVPDQFVGLLRRCWR